MRSFDADVIVAGAGPVGMSLAVSLAARGRSVTVLEALPDLNEEERASTFHPPTLELLREWGVLGQAVERGRVIDRLQYWERGTRELVAEFPYSLISGDTLCPFRLQCPQSIVTRLLRPKVPELHFGQTVTAVHSDESGATVETDERRFRGRYVVGADGAGSAVRKSLGVRLAGHTYADRFLLVGTEVELEAMLPGAGPVAYVFDPEEWVIVMHLPDRVRLVFRIDPEEDDQAVREPAAVRKRVTGFLGPDVPFGVKSISVYGVHQRVAERLRAGRVLLAGDAAHVNNPVGGFGMNAGIQDAHALAVALDAALHGSDTALDEYARVRREDAAARINVHADLNYRQLAAEEQRARMHRNAQLREAAADPALAREWLLRASMLADRVRA